MEHQDEVSTTLCPAVVRIQQASCDALASVGRLSALIGGMRVLRATANTTRDVDFKTYYTQSLYTGLYMPGVVHDPAELAVLLIHLATSNKRVEHTHQAVRFVATNSNNGWAVCLAAAFMIRTHGAGFHGLAVNNLKTEWATVRDLRVLLEKLSLSWRAPEAFDAAADAALMTYHPHVRNSLSPTTFAKAATLMPVSWVGLPPPFDICMRLGMYDRQAVLDDIALLGGWCREFAYHGEAQVDAAEIAHALSAAHSRAGGHSHSAQQSGAFVVLSSSHLRAASHEELAQISARSAIMPLANLVPFQFVNKTPPAAPELYEPFCIQDFAGCNFHRGVPGAQPM
eukprot:CAMPEP_0115832782 /NCGR_PEP_ID=MMETSP0287-20121206/2836_1 /TAXON_ID=412157 /ORGANISM="Chrysochromulina rotalis, Strain UIO044" /LENGTH=340 /DNA_ID=CAMNT_0003286179 /DNA_START=53 /DNA_END=1075 /DNA_ORIENTATION=+